MRRSRAAHDLAFAPVSYCPSCGRHTKTVGEGACADCWEAKEIGGKPGLGVPPPRTESLGLFDGFDVFHSFGALQLLGLAIALVLTVVAVFLGAR